MGLGNFIRGQFLDTIEWIDPTNKIIVWKYQRPSGDNEIKQGAKLIVRESQCALFINKGTLADCFSPGIYILNTDNLPILSSLNAIGHLFNSPIKSDLYFVNTKQFTGNKWATKNAVMMRDVTFNMVRVRCFGQYSFKVTSPELFMKEVFGTRGLVMSWDIIQYLSGMLAEAFGVVIPSVERSVLDLSAHYKEIAGQLQAYVNQEANSIGIEFRNVIVENISLPNEVEKLIDEQSGISMANSNMQAFLQYQAARAMRDASKQEGGLAGLGVGFAAGNNMMNNMIGSQTDSGSKDIVKELKDLKALVDAGILTQEEFDKKKKQLLNLN